jgi:hypothetical protein
MYNSINDAKVALQNSGVFEWFDFDEIPEKTVYQWMYENDATPEQAAQHFGVA